MLCDHCENREAVLHLTQIVDNQMSTFHLCEECAAEQGLEPGVHSTDVPLTDFIAQMGKSLPEESVEDAGACSYCGLTPEVFKKTGRLGCSHCYVTFEPQLRNLIRRIHGGTQHVGKVYLPPDPSRAEREKRLEGLRRKLHKAVEVEDFERAAQIRDQIHVLEAAE